MEVNKMSLKSVLFTTLIFFTFLEGELIAQTKSAEVLLNAGNALVAQERYADAIGEYAKVGPLQRELYSRALYNIGVCYYELMETERAVLFYRRAIAIGKANYPRAAYALGIALEDLKRLPEAKEAYLLASQSGVIYGPALFKLGVIAANAGDLKTATQFFRQATLSEGAHGAASHNNLGVTLALQGNFKEAEIEFQLALAQTDGVYPDAEHNLGLCRVMLQTADQVRPADYQFLMNDPTVFDKEQH
jgi:tetratricopeptide (TPR) repeat protein